MTGEKLCHSDSIWNYHPICDLHYSVGRLNAFGAKPGEVYQRNFEFRRIWMYTLLDETAKGRSIKDILFTDLGFGPKPGWDMHPIKISWIKWEDGPDGKFEETEVGGSWDLFVSVVEKRFTIAKRTINQMVTERIAADSL